MMFDPSLNPDLSSDESALVLRVVDFTRGYFSDPKFDASHDFNHVLRVTATACKILDQESKIRAMTTDIPQLNTLMVILGALMHDVDDKKYVDTSTNGYIPIAKKKLVQFGASEDLASNIQILIEGVSFSSEVKDPQRVKETMQAIPELAIVQDADRLDAMGAIGIGRCFVFGALKGARDMNSSIDHFDDKLLKLEGMMKTKTGASLAATYADRLKTFKSWWEDELLFGS